MARLVWFKDQPLVVGYITACLNMVSCQRHNSIIQLPWLPRMSKSPFFLKIYNWCLTQRKNRMLIAKRINDVDAQASRPLQVQITGAGQGPLLAGRCSGAAFLTLTCVME